MSGFKTRYVQRKRGIRDKLRAGWGMLDMFVAFTLVVATIAAVTPLMLRHGRLLQSQRQYRIALEELTSHLDRLTALEANELTDAIAELKPSEFAAERLPGASLSATLTEATGGAQHIAIHLSWDTPGRRETPVSLVGWAFPPPAAVGATDGGQP